MLHLYYFSSLLSSFLTGAFFTAGFLAGDFFSVFTSSFFSSLLSAFLVSFSSFSSFLAGALVRAFKDKPILFFLGSKFIILALTSSQTLTCSLMSLTTL
jgi:hypothetical protein